MDTLESYLKSHFKDLKFSKPLFYNAKIGIRFKMGCPSVEFDQKLYCRFAYIRAKLLFDEIFSGDSNIYLVINEHKDINEAEDDLRGIDIYKKYLKNKAKYKEVEIREIPYPYQEEGEEWFLKTFRYSMLLKVRDLKYNLLLESIVNKMGGAFEYDV